MQHSFLLFYGLGPLWAGLRRELDHTLDRRGRGTSRSAADATSAAIAAATVTLAPAACLPPREGTAAAASGFRDEAAAAACDGPALSMTRPPSPIFRTSPIPYHQEIAHAISGQWHAHARRHAQMPANAGHREQFKERPLGGGGRRRTDRSEAAAGRPRPPSFAAADPVRGGRKVGSRSRVSATRLSARGLAARARG